jgi:hypothetical protein
MKSVLPDQLALGMGDDPDAVNANDLRTQQYDENTKDTKGNDLFRAFAYFVLFVGVVPGATAPPTNVRRP